MKGRITGISGPTVTVAMSGLRLYDRVSIGGAGLLGEVVRLERRHAVVQVYEDTRGLALHEPVTGLGVPLTVRLGPGLLNTMFDGLQRPLEKLGEDGAAFIQPGQELPPLDESREWLFTPVGKPGERVGPGALLGEVEEGGRSHLITMPPGTQGKLAQLVSGPFRLGEPVARLEDGEEIFAWHDWPVRSPRPYLRKLPPIAPLITGQRSIDMLFPLARGGTAIFPGGFGTGKTVLEQSVAKFADADLVVYVGCGERGNEMAEMVEEFVAIDDPWSGRPLMDRTVLVVNTSNMPVAAREASIFTAVTMAEYYRDMGLDVLFLADSLSRWAEALREISSALEEMPGEEGYPTYLASRMAEFMARAGVVETADGRQGSLSMILSVSPPGGDFTEPVTQACLRTSGAFFMLDSRLAQRRHFPAINWNQSYSLYEQVLGDHFTREVAGDWSSLKRECRELLQREEKLREVAEIVGTEGLQESDRLVMEVAAELRNGFLAQNAYSEDAFSPPQQTAERLRSLLADYRRRKAQAEQENRERAEPSGTGESEP